MNPDATNFLFGNDVEERKREQVKQYRPVHPDFGNIQQKTINKKSEKKLKKKENKLQNQQPNGAKKDIPIQKQHPASTKLISILNSENQMVLEEFVKIQFTTGIPSQEFTPFPPESDFGDTEYKLRLVNPDLEKLTHLTTQMNYRLQEGHGVAYYKIGVEDSGNPHGLNQSDMLDSLWTLCQMASSLKAEILIVGLRPGYRGKIAEIMVRKPQKEGIKLDIRILLLGISGSGKTSLLGVLSSGQYDNGQGLARMKILRNKSEILSGRTERVSHTVIGFDSEGRQFQEFSFSSIINHQQSQQAMHNIEKIIDLSTKLITFIDMGGNKRAHTQMIQIINSQFPDYAILVISAIQELNKFTEDYFKLLSVQQLPLVIVITHVDVATEMQIDGVIDQIKDILENIEDRRIPIIARNMDDFCAISNQLQKKQVLPIFLLSNVLGHSMSSFIHFLNLLPSTNQLIGNQYLHSELSIHNTFENDIIAGTVIKGVIKKNQILQLGPDKESKFYPVEVEEIKCNRVKVNCVQCGQICTIKVKFQALAKKFFENGNVIRNGMVLVDGSKVVPRGYWEFEAEIWLFECDKEVKNISFSYEPVINFQTSRQICKIIKDFNESLDCKLSLQKQKSKSIDTKKIDLVQKKKQFPRKNSSINLKEEKTQSVEKNHEEEHKNQSRTNNLFVINEKKKESQDIFRIVPGEMKLLRLRFRYNPEYIEKGMKLIINDNYLGAVGWVKKCIY